MTEQEKQEKNIKLAEFEGWKDIELIGAGPKICPFDGYSFVSPGIPFGHHPEKGIKGPIPNYFGSFDEIYRLEQYVWSKDWNLRAIFVDKLARILDPIHGYRNQSGVDLLDATALQRFEALGQTLKLW